MQRAERLAISLFDLDRIPLPVQQMMGLAERLDRNKGHLIRVNPDKLDETAVPFLCDILAAACLLDTIRSHDRMAGDYPTRCYLNRTGNGAWYRLTRSDTLTRIIGGRVELNPDLFPSSVNVVEAKPLPVKRI